MTRIHAYRREDGGSLHVFLMDTEDYGGERTVTGEIIPLVGWPSPAMRQAVDGSGTTCAWYIGTDADGAIVRV